MFGQPAPRLPGSAGVTLYVTRISSFRRGAMIQSYRDKRTGDFSAGKRIKALSGFARQAELKLDQLDAATSLRDLFLPGNRLQAFKGGRLGQCSIRINDQWRLCFEWPSGEPGPMNVETVDYH